MSEAQGYVPTTEERLAAAEEKNRRLVRAMNLACEILRDFRSRDAAHELLHVALAYDGSNDWPPRDP